MLEADEGNLVPKGSAAGAPAHSPLISRSKLGICALVLALAVGACVSWFGVGPINDSVGYMGSKASLKFLAWREGMQKFGVSQTRIPRTVHYVWMANGVKPYFLASLDSVARAIPDCEVKIHIVTPAGADDDVLNAIRRRLELQLRPLTDFLFNVEVILHPDINIDFAGTPIANLGVTQAHMGGRVENLLGKPNRMLSDRGGSPHGDKVNAMLHASDVFRTVVLYKYGGIYMDTDHIVLKDFFPFVSRMGSFIICETKLTAQADGLCKTLNGFAGFSAGHPFLLDSLTRVKSLIQNFTVNGVFPIHKKTKNGIREVWLTAVGPDLFAKVKNQWMSDLKDVWVISAHHPAPLAIRKLRHRPTTYCKAAKKKKNVDCGVPTSSLTELTVIGREDFIPTFWREITLSQNKSAGLIERYQHAYSFHLWEMGKSSTNQIRPHFVNLLMHNKSSMLNYLHKQCCMAFCDPELLVNQSRIELDLTGA